MTAQLGRTTAPQTILVADTGSTMRVVSAGNLGNADWSTPDKKDFIIITTSFVYSGKK